MNVLTAGLIGFLTAASGVEAAQAPARVPVPSQVQRPVITPGPPGPVQGQVVTVVGCVQRESDFRRVNQSPNAVTIIGSGDDVVLINAGVSVIGSPIAGTQAQAPPEPARGGSGSAGQSVGRAGTVPAVTTGASYQLTGSRESDAAVLVGRWVEITGTLRASTPVESTALPAAGASPNVTDVTSRELNLRQLEVDTVRTLSGACAAP